MDELREPIEIVADLEAAKSRGEEIDEAELEAALDAMPVIEDEVEDEPEVDDQFNPPADDRSGTDRVVKSEVTNVNTDDDDPIVIETQVRS